MAQQRDDAMWERVREFERQNPRIHRAGGKSPQMTDEQRFVVRPLVRWFRRPGTQWRLHRPRHDTSATGWDLEARRKNSYLLIEAKYFRIRSPFFPRFSGLVTAPLANRAQRLMRRKRQSVQGHVCWAIGTSYAYGHLYQVLLDHLVGNPAFWRHYSRDWRVKYVFFVRDGKVARVRFADLLKAADEYRARARGRNLTTRRAFAEALMGGLMRFE